MTLLLGSAVSATPSAPFSTACIVVDDAESDQVEASQPEAGQTAPAIDAAPEASPFPPIPSITNPPLTNPSPWGGTTVAPIPSEPSSPDDTSTPALQEPPVSSPSVDAVPPAPTLVTVNQLAVTGSTIFSAEDIEPIVQPLRGQTVSIQALQAAADQITERYVQAGYITSFADLDEDSLGSETIQIEVIEGSIAEIQVSGLDRLEPGYLCSRLQLATEAPVNANRLEERLRLLKIDPLFSSVEAILQRVESDAPAAQPDSRRGRSILRVVVTEADPIDLEVRFDNHFPSTIAPQTATVGFRHRNLAGFGDELAFSYSVGVNVTDFPRAALNLYDLSYRIPLNPQEGALQFRGVYSDSAVTAEEFEEFGFRGTSEFYELVYRQPLVRSLREEFAVSVGFTIQNGQTFIFDNNPQPFEEGPDDDGFSRTRVLRIGQDYVRRDTQGAWALQSQFNFGLDLFDATNNSGSVPDGQFFSWLAQAVRFQELGNDYRLIVRSGLQLTPDPLLSSQQFFLGGASSLRGYPPNSRRGDNGTFLSVEGRIPVARNPSGAPIFQLAPFAEVGYVWNDPSNPNEEDDPRFLSDIGLGFLYQPNSDLSLQLDLALPFVELGDRREQPQDNGIYFSASYRF
ncbi:BamA/TamA family outer membrane protein [Oculatella sp. LEGE 06141]|uniref:ShlB/FhaC/HecB family hemolysin secretion/activation protein n=1 Tax=Oculatella sp. LEGE 06141 TaxID=1828648 RepID=UPI001881B732|nr:ShlB/FhaC/HecB family hemolysin secretion/activation protein [Oculatella sp. LEGE 06141]MBE9180639.1 BamA/TamA family outer membrane protein [Oculatella sp. LEGE 06141]